MTTGTPTPPSPRRKPAARESVTTAAGLAAQRAAMADRERRTSRAQSAARRLEAARPTRAKL